MAASTTESTNGNDRRAQVMVGDLPTDFLRVTGDPQVEADHQAAQALQAQQSGFGTVANMPRLSVTIVQAKLSKNYGITRMDPYCRIRVGHSVFETQSAFSGGKNPHWNKTVYCYVPPGVDTIYLEIFDERTFMMDDRVAWAHVQIPEAVLSGESRDDWYLLSGKQGEAKEGMINLVLSYSKAPAAQHVMYTPGMQPVVMVPTVPMYQYTVPAGYPGGMVAPGTQQQQQQPPQQMPPQQQQQQQQQQCVTISDEDISQVKELFPNMDDEAIRSVLEANRGNKDRAINDLLQMNS